MSLRTNGVRSKSWGVGARCCSEDTDMRHGISIASANELARVASTAMRSLRAAEKLKEEMLALRDCLYESGALSDEKYLVSVHRRHFAAVLEAHSLESTARKTTFPDLLSVHELKAATLAYLRKRDTDSLHAASRALCEITRGIPYTTSSYLYVVGGYDSHQSLRGVERFDPEDGTWEAAPPLCVARRSPAVAAVQGRLYVCGGMHDSSGRRRYLSSAESFDIVSGVWEPLPPMSVERAQAVSVGFDGCLCVVGGFDGRQYLASAEAYCPLEGSWRLLPRTTQACARAVAAVVDDSFYVCGGFDGPRALATGEMFDPLRCTWERLPEMAERRRGAAGARIGKQLIICGGYDGTSDLTSVESFDTEEGYWTYVAPMIHPLGEASGSALAGCLYVCGGLDSSVSFLSTEDCVQCYDPQSDAWELKPRMLKGRAWAASAALHDICGGSPMWSSGDAWM